MTLLSAKMPGEGLASGRPPGEVEGHLKDAPVYK